MLGFLYNVYYIILLCDNLEKDKGGFVMKKIFLPLPILAVCFTFFAVQKVNGDVINYENFNYDYPV